MSAAIEIVNLTKQYPVPLKREAVNAVDNLSLTVDEGEIFGFLGANGAGKTTTIKILLGLIYPTAGDASVLGAPAGDIAVKHKIAYLPESPYFYEHMTALEVVTFYAQLFGLDKNAAKKRAEELVDFVGLGNKSDRNKRINEFSKGMRQRVGIAQSLINDPKILFYDEPTSGLDAIARRDIRDLMLELKRQGKTMFLSSHQLEDVEMVCHRVSIIHKGKLRTLGFVDELLAGERVEITVASAPNSFGERLRALAPGAIIAGGAGVITVANDPGLVSQIVDLARQEQARIVSIVPKRRTLEDLFVEIVGERISPDTPMSTVAGNVRIGGRDDLAEPAPVQLSPSQTDVPSDSTTKPSRPGANKYKELNRK
jgi:ABC-2 type transport system ATP-binding protein